MQNHTANRNENPIGFLLLLLLIIFTWAGFAVYIISARNTPPIPAPIVDISPIQQKQDALEKKLEELSKTTPSIAPENNNSDIPQTITDAKLAAQELETIKTELATIKERNIALETALADISAKLQSNGSQENNNLMLAAMRLRDAVKESRNFESDLMMLKALPVNDAEINDSIKILEQNAKGTASIATLRDEFDPIATNILKLARMQKTNPDLLDKAVLRMSKIVKVRKIDSTSRSNDPEDIIARIYNDLQKNDLPEAVKEINLLPKDAQDLASDWLKKAGDNIATKDAAEKVFLYATRPVK
jgi:hypothetical protein